MIAPLETNQSPRLEPSREETPALSREHARRDQAHKAPEAHQAPESVENEINRLTWSVLDGNATAAQRRRLAELVAEQHNRRPPR
ncbi:MAG: hypothetical protein AAGA92_05095 [Planctomycetota bacterium]